VGSALGFFTAPRAFDLIRSHKVSLDDADFSQVEVLFKDMEAECAHTLARSGKTEDILFERSMDMRFVGQGSETHVPAPEGNFSGWLKTDVRKGFDDIYEKLYGRTYHDTPVEFINFKVRASLPERLLQLPKMVLRSSDSDGAVKGHRQAFSGVAGDFIPYTVYDRYRLSPGMSFQGPAIIEERESTVVVGEDAKVTVDEYGFLWIEVKT
jgi:N-methylhydantoinase A/oxoprolinase/acetone carboxylase beta subunit